MGNTLSRSVKGSAETTEEGFKNISQPTKAKIGKASFYIYSAIVVISTPLLRVGKDLVGLVYFLKFLLSPGIFIAIRMVLES
jgi:hypothetical protein